jgi:hypothetical protein
MVGKFEDANGNEHLGHPFCTKHARLIAASFDLVALHVGQVAAAKKRRARRTKASDFEGTVYFGLVGDRVKIGYSGNAYKRRKQIETAAGVRFERFEWMMGDRSDERRLHADFAEHRLVGEWFTADPTVLAGLHREFSKRAA